MKGIKKPLMVLLGLFLAYLIASTPSTTVTAAEPWGTLKAGDEMRWNTEWYGTVEMRILGVDGNKLTIELKEGGYTEVFTVDAESSELNAVTTRHSIISYLMSKPDLNSKIEWGYEVSTYEWQGTTYKAYYKKDEFVSGDMGEHWKDFDTGIAFESRWTDADGTVEVSVELESTNADLAESTGGGCLGTVYIAAFSIIAIISYGLVRYRKKKTP